MSKKSKEKNNLKLSILLLILLLIVLIASTYAWFTANQTVTVDSVDVHIEAQNGLQISTNATDWKSLIENTDITNSGDLTVKLDELESCGFIRKPITYINGTSINCWRHR